MSDIKAGDTCEILGPITNPPSMAIYVGTECVVVQGPHFDPMADGFSACEIKTHDGGAYLIATYLLRKKRPPEQKTTWDRCVWRPQGVTA